MFKAFLLSLILIVLSASVSFSQEKRSKKKKKKHKQEQVEEQEPEEEEPLEENLEDDEYSEDENIEDQQDVDKNQIEKKEIKEGETLFKTKSRPSKVALFLERFQFNFASGYGVTSWKSAYYEQAYRHTDNSLVSSHVKYKGTGLNVPFHLQLLLDLNKIRIGGGASMDFYFMKKLRPKKGEEFREFELKGIGSFRKFYGHLGFKYFENRMYDYLFDVEVGMFKGSPAVNTASNSYRPFVNVGVTLERKYSEYFRMFLKPSLEYKSQPFLLGEPPLPINNHKLLTFYALWGVSYSIPFVKKCPIKACGIRIHHHHSGKVFRGNPVQRLQNPDYGEEDRKLIRDRGKNKRKLDPY